MKYVGVWGLLLFLGLGKTVWAADADGAATKTTGVRWTVERERAEIRRLVAAPNPKISAALGDGEVAAAASGIVEQTQEWAKANEVLLLGQVRALEAWALASSPEVASLLRCVEAEWNRFRERARRWGLPRSPQVYEGTVPESDERQEGGLTLDGLLDLAVQGAPLLQRFSSGERKALFELQPGSLEYFPTLFDQVIYFALQMRGALREPLPGESPGDDEGLDRVHRGIVPLFGDAKDFVAGELTLGTNAAAHEKVLFLWRDLIRCHLNDTNSTALVYADLKRLKWAYQVTDGDVRNGPYLEALRRLVERWKGDRMEGEICRALADAIRDSGDPDEARRWAARGTNAPVGTKGEALCRALLEELDRSEFVIATESVWSGPRPLLKVDYRNVPKLFLRIVPLSSFPESGGENVSLEKLRSLKPVREWDVDLPRFNDTRSHPCSIRVPKRLPPGRYMLLASSEPAFSRAKLTTWAPLSVSDLAVVLRATLREDDDGRDDADPEEEVSSHASPERPGRLVSKVHGLVVDAVTGEPVKGARINIRMEEDSKAARPVAKGDEDEDEERGNNGGRNQPKTDAMGCFEITEDQFDGISGLEVVAGRRRLELPIEEEPDLYSDLIRGSVPDGEEQPTTGRQTFLFTDRAIYRPGQTVRYKGICLLASPSRSEYCVLPDREVELVIRGPNAIVLERRKHRTGAFGSFSGEYNIPTNSMTGVVRLQVEQFPKGETSVRVEEYRRPRFTVILDKPEKAMVIGDIVTLRGRAMTFSGVPVDGARVSWRLDREAEIPGWVDRIQPRSPWRQYREPWDPRFLSSNLIRGSTRTAPDGSFTIECAAMPDRSIARTNQPTFQFTIHAEVADETGEVQSGERTFGVGYSALKVEVEVDPWQQEGSPVVLRLRTTTHSGEGTRGGGRVRIQHLAEPSVTPTPSPEGGNQIRYDYLGESELFSDGLDDGDRDPSTWPVDREAWSGVFETDLAGNADLHAPLARGLYLVVVETQDASGWSVSSIHPLVVFQPSGSRLGLKLPFVVEAPSWKIEPGGKFRALWGTGYDTGRALVEVELRGNIIRKFWTKPGRTQQWLEFPVDESMRGGFTLHVTQVRNNRLFKKSRRVEVPWTTKDLLLTWGHFKSKCQPGGHETWSLVVKPRLGKASPTNLVEMVATLYDASLDSLKEPLEWPSRLNVFPRDFSWRRTRMWNMTEFREPESARYETGFWKLHPHAPPELAKPYSRPVIARSEIGGSGVVMQSVAVSAMQVAAPPKAGFFDDASKRSDRDHEKLEAKRGRLAPHDLGRIRARTNLQETAFFLPHLVSGTNGEIRIEFTMPEALTTWRFLGFAHDAALRHGYIEASTQTSLELMVEPIPPRFLREGDLLEFPVKVANRSPRDLSGRVRLSLRHASTDRSADSDMKLTALAGSATSSDLEQTFEIPAGQSRSFSWRLEVPEGCGLLAYKAVASTSELSDGEEGWLPVQPRRVRVSESVPLAIEGDAKAPETVKRFRLEGLLRSAKAEGIGHEKLTFQLSSYPSALAVVALPFLMEFPHECSEQTFNRLYANAVAGSLAKRNPRAREILEQALRARPYWPGPTGGWERRGAYAPTDLERVAAGQESALRKLVRSQHADGAWSWWPGGESSPYLSMYIVSGFSRLREFGIELPADSLEKAVRYLDGWVAGQQRLWLRSDNPGWRTPDPLACLYLFARSPFLEEHPVPAEAADAITSLRAQAREHWEDVPSIQNQGQLAIALHRFGAAEDRAAATRIVESLRKRSTRSEGQGMRWAHDQAWQWWDAPVESQATMIEMFDEVAGDAEAVEACRTGLLTLRRGSEWPSTRATADAIHALLRHGGDLFAGTNVVQAELGGKDLLVAGGNAAGPAFLEKVVPGREVTPDLGEVVLRASGRSVGRGSLTWDYFQDVERFKPVAGAALSIRRVLFRRVSRAVGDVLEPVQGPVALGEELVVRLTVQADRGMDYVHLEDQREAGLEPVDVASGMHYSGGIAVYQSTRDTATHFFIDRLHEGTFTIDYRVRVRHRGRFQSGIAFAECMYATDLRNGTGSGRLIVE